MYNVPQALVANNFAQICSAIDEGHLDETIVALFNESRLDLRANVDHRIQFLRFITGAIEASRQARDAYKERVKQLEYVEERIKQSTLGIMGVMQKESVEGDLGRLCSQKNPEALDLKFDTNTLSITNVIEPSLIEMHSIPDRYIKKLAAFQLDTKQVKEDLKQGAIYAWASLSRGTNLRIRV